MASAGRKKRVAPALLHKVEQFNDDVNDAFIVPHEDAVVTASDDKCVIFSPCELVLLSITSFARCLEY